MLKIFSLCTLISLSVSGCAIALNLPANRFDSPEASGRGSGSITGGYSESAKVTFVEDVTITPFAQSTAYDRSGILQGGASFGVLKDLDIGVTVNATALLSSPTSVKVKYQLMGEPKSAAKQGNFSLAGSFAVGYGQNTSTTNSIFTDVHASTDTSQWVMDLAAIAGYRVADRIMIYGGPFYTRGGISGTVKQTVSSVATTYSVSGRLTQAGANLGIQFDPALFMLRLEGAYAKAASDSLSKGDLYGGLQLGFCW